MPQTSKKKPQVIVPNYLDLKSGDRKVWITVDDGPHEKHTKTVLKALADNNVRATFFLLGVNLKANPKVLKEIVAGGHRIGNHAYSHKILTDKTEKQIKSEIERCEKLIGDSIGKDKLFRAPYGAMNKKVEKVVRDLGYRHVGWNVDTEDWKPENQPDGWVQQGVEQIRKRSSNIVLVHDIHPTTARYFDTFLKRVAQISKVKYQSPTDL